MGQKMEFPKRHDRPNDSKEPINKQNVFAIRLIDSTKCKEKELRSCTFGNAMFS